MEWLLLALGLLLGVLSGGVLALSVAGRRLAVREQRIADLERELRAGEARRAAAEARAIELERGLAGQRALLDEARHQLADTFHAVAAEALRNNNEGFLALAGERLAAVQGAASLELEARQDAIAGVVAPVREAMERIDRQLREVERGRAEAYGGLLQQVSAMSAEQRRLQAETANLVKALRAPHVRGRWGEVQLRRVVELAGMLDHCDFDEQATVGGDEARLRPDLVVRLPGGRSIVVDAKAPLAAYLEAVEAPDEERRATHLREHAAQVRAHVARLASKAYWEQFAATPEFVVLFLPGEAFYATAIEQMPSLIEQSVGERVLLASPMTLIALLKSVHFGWRQESLAQNAQEISQAGRELHERVATFVEHAGRVGAALERSVSCFNGMMASLETRVLPSARRLEQLHAAGKKPLPALDVVQLRPRSPSKQLDVIACDEAERDAPGGAPAGDAARAARSDRAGVAPSPDGNI